MSSPHLAIHYKESFLGAPLTIERIHRRLRGGSQSFLVECDDKHFYAAKFLGNPQGNRSVINEVFFYPIIKAAEVLTPRLVLLHLPPDIAKDDRLYFAMGNKRIRPEGTLHLGSQFPVNPDLTAIFDLLPSMLFSKIRNLNDVAKVFVLDKYVHHTDKRQAVFTRDRRFADFLMHFIDHGMCFANWVLGDEPLHGLMFDRTIYSKVDMRRETEKALSLVDALPDDIFPSAIEAVPPSWFAPGDMEALAALQDSLRKRKGSLPLLVKRHLDDLGL